MSVTTWLVIATVLIAIEIASVSLTSIWFAIGAFASAVCALFTDNLWIQLSIFIVLSIVLWICTRRIAIDKLKIGKDNVEKTNVESLAGQRAIVTATINNLTAEGQAKVNGLEWTARSVDNSIIEAGSTVMIREVSGVKLIVEKLPQTSIGL